MKFIFLSILSLLSYCAKSQEFDWTSTKGWKLYAVRGHGLFGYSLDTLHHFKSYSLNDDSIRPFFKNVQEMPSSRAPVWMGVMIATCVSGETVLKLEISQYGGFFYCEKNKKYYQITDGYTKEWLNYLSTCQGSLYYKQ